MNRRDFLWQSGGGLGGVALAALLGADGLLAAGAALIISHGTPAFCRALYNANEFVYVP